MEINLRNIESLIFHDREAQKLLPEFAPNFDQWRLAHRIPGLKQMGKRAVLDVLNGLTGEHIEKLEKHLQDSIILTPIDGRIVVNTSAEPDALDDILCEVTNIQDFCLYRSKDQVHVTFWR